MPSWVGYSIGIVLIIFGLGNIWQSGYQSGYMEAAKKFSLSESKGGSE